MLVRADGTFNRAAIMAKAHSEYRSARMRGDGRSFAYWLSYSWRVAKSRREALRLPLAA